MAVFTYNDFRKVLARLSFEMKRVSISHKRSKDIPHTVFHKMLKQAGIESEEELVSILRGRRTKMTP